MIALEISDELFWVKLDREYSQRIRNQYTLEGWRLELDRALRLEITRDRPPGAHVYYYKMVDDYGPIIEWTHYSNYSNYNYRLDELKKKWVKIYKELVGNKLVFELLLENPLPSKWDV